MFTYSISFNLYNFFVLGREDITILFLPINKLIGSYLLVRDGAKNQK